jgi:hypothetical protein
MLLDASAEIIFILIMLRFQELVEREISCKICVVAHIYPFVAFGICEILFSDSIEIR